MLFTFACLVILSSIPRLSTSKIYLRRLLLASELTTKDILELAEDLIHNATFNQTTYFPPHDVNTSSMTSSKGVIVLGMHRSGTSMLTGAMSLACGYNTGDNLIPPRKHNPKGYFERIDVVKQNIQFLKGVPEMNAGKIRKYHGTINRNHNASIALSRDGQSAVEFFNQDNSTIPWIQKDPRMCLTLKEWLPFIKTKPAILITYRHPLEVGRSIQKRDRKSLSEGLDAWVAYNEILLRNTAGMCRVVTNNNDVLRNGPEELRRIVQELTTRCHVVAPPNPTPIGSMVESFVDANLQKRQPNHSLGCNNGTSWNNNTQILQRAMKLYCDMQSGVAFQSNYTI